MNSKLFMVPLLFSALILGGCSTNNNHVTSSVAPSKNIFVKEIKAVPAPQSEIKTPIDFVNNSILWYLSNGKIISAKNGKVVFSITFNDTAVVDVEVPDVTNQLFYVFYLHKNKEVWSMPGVVGAPVFAPKHSNTILPPPYNNFISSQMPIKDIGTFWLFYNSQQVISIGNVIIPNQYPLPKGAQVILTNGLSATLVQQNNASFIYYIISPNRLVWIGGNIPEKNLIQLAGSQQLSFVQAPIN